MEHEEKLLNQAEAEQAAGTPGFGSWEATRQVAGVRQLHFGAALQAYYENR